MVHIVAKIKSLDVHAHVLVVFLDENFTVDIEYGDIFGLNSNFFWILQKVSFFSQADTLFFTFWDNNILESPDIYFFTSLYDFTGMIK